MPRLLPCSRPAPEPTRCRRRRRPPRGCSLPGGPCGASAALTHGTCKFASQFTCTAHTCKVQSTWLAQHAPLLLQLPPRADLPCLPPPCLSHNPRQRSAQVNQHHLRRIATHVKSGAVIAGVGAPPALPAPLPLPPPQALLQGALLLLPQALLQVWRPLRCCHAAPPAARVPTG